MRASGTRIAGILLLSAVSPAESSDKYGFCVAPAAVDVGRQGGKGSAQIEYYVREPYPAPETLSFLKQCIDERRWRPVTGPELAPYESSSLESGWVDLPGLRGSSLGRLWSARWLDARGNEVVYTLSYDSPLMERGAQPLYVSVAAWYASKHAARHRRDIEEMVKRLVPPLCCQGFPPQPVQPCPSQ